MHAQYSCWDVDKFNEMGMDMVQQIGLVGTGTLTSFFWGFEETGYEPCIADILGH